MLQTGATVVWAVSSEIDGPVTTAAQLDSAFARQLLYLGDTDTSINFSVCGFSAPEGNYYITPVIIEDPTPQPMIYDTLIGCKPFAEFCPIVNLDSTAAWEISTFDMTFPDGSGIDVIQAIGANYGLQLTSLSPGLISIIGSIPCVNLTSLFKGDPNGQWTMTVTNTGTGPLTIDVPTFTISVESDTCPLITQDQVASIPGFSVTLNPGETHTQVIYIPALPQSYPNVLASCQGFGTAVPFYFKDCENSISEVFSINNIAVYPNPNQGVFTLEFNMPRPEKLSVSCYTIEGKAVYREDIGMTNAGLNKWQIDNMGLSPGIYFVELRSETMKGITKVVIN